MTKMLRPVHSLSALVVVASVTGGAFAASAALRGFDRPASVTVGATREDAAALVQNSTEQRDMQAAVDLVNAERAKLGLPAFTWNDTVAAAARAHSTDMARTGIMQHGGSDGSDTGDRLDRVGFVWGGWGETIGAGYQTAPPLIAAWMASPGHRAILTGDYRWVGIAVVRSATGTPYWTLVAANGG